MRKIYYFQIYSLLISGLFLPNCLNGLNLVIWLGGQIDPHETSEIDSKVQWIMIRHGFVVEMVFFTRTGREVRTISKTIFGGKFRPYFPSMIYSSWMDTNDGLLTLIKLGAGTHIRNSCWGACPRTSEFIKGEISKKTQKYLVLQGVKKLCGAPTAPRKDFMCPNFCFSLQFLKSFFKNTWKNFLHPL